MLFAQARPLPLVFPCFCRKIAMRLKFHARHTRVHMPWTLSRSPDVVRAEIAGVGEELLRLVQTGEQHLHPLQQRPDLVLVVDRLGDWGPAPTGSR